MLWFTNVVYSFFMFFFWSCTALRAAEKNPGTDRSDTICETLLNIIQSQDGKFTNGSRNGLKQWSSTWGSPRCPCTTNPISPSKHGQWSGLMGILFHQHGVKAPAVATMLKLGRSGQCLDGRLEESLCRPPWVLWWKKGVILNKELKTWMSINWILVGGHLLGTGKLFLLKKVYTLLLTSLEAELKLDPETW